jgi:hypothetical protein
LAPKASGDQIPPTYDGICHDLPFSRSADYGRYTPWNDGMQEKLAPLEEIADQSALLSISSLSMVLVDGGAFTTY